MEDDFENIDEKSEMFKALEDFQDLNKGLDGKTSLRKPISFASLQSFADYLEKIRYFESAKTIRIFIEYVKKLNISKDGKGREQFIQLFTEMNRSNKLESDNLTDITRTKSII